MFQRKAISLFLIAAFVMPVAAFGQAAAVYTAPKETIDKIREEGMNKSQVMLPNGNDERETAAKSGEI